MKAILGIFVVLRFSIVQPRVQAGEAAGMFLDVHLHVDVVGFEGQEFGEGIGRMWMGLLKPMLFIIIVCAIIVCAINIDVWGAANEIYWTGAGAGCA